MSRPRQSLRYGLVALIGAIVLLVSAPPPPAPAAKAHFYCTLLAPNTWCRHGTWHNYYAMAVIYPGTGNIPVCSRMVRRLGGGVYASICATNSASSNFGRCNCGGLWDDIKHGAPNDRNLRGWGAY